MEPFTSIRFDFCRSSCLKDTGAREAVPPHQLAALFLPTSLFGEAQLLSGANLRMQIAHTEKEDGLPFPVINHPYLCSLSTSNDTDPVGGDI